jgi:hypothetical protein
MKWVQLDQPGQFAAESQAMGHSVRGYEPPEGHPDWIPESGDSGSLGYGHGGWEGIKSGRAKIYSLVDPKGNPHTTIEVGKPNGLMGWQEIKRAGGDPLAIQNEAKRRMGLTPEKESELVKSWDGTERARQQALLDQNMHDIYVEQFGEPTQNITQIKGKSNRSPKEQYLPFVQDFVKSGNWSDVGDLHNTGLHKVVENQPIPGFQEWMRLRSLGNEPKIPSGYYTPEELVKHGEESGLKENYPSVHESWRKNLGLEPEVAPTVEVPPNLPPETPQYKKGGAVSFTDNPDAMFMEVNDRKFGIGGGVSKMLERAAPKTLEEIKAIAERIAPQVMGEATGVVGKSNKQFLREKSLPIDIRVNTPMPDPDIVDLAKHKGKVMIGIKGDPTVSNQTLHKVGDIELESPSPQHGGPLYGQGRDVFWASGLGPAQGVQNLAKEASQAYNAPVLGNYFMMGPDSYYYAQHLADANLNAIAKSGMTPEQIEKLNELIRKGGPLSKGPKPNFETVEDIGNAYMQMQMDPKLRKHFNQLMMKPTLSEEIGIPRGQDIAHAITLPSLRNLERGVTGASIGEMRPDQPLTLSSHPTYSHDIPGSFLGTSPYPVPYELSFPDTVKSVRSIPEQASQEFGSFGMVGPRQPIDQQLIDEIGEYQRQMKILTGKKEGGEVHMAGGGSASKALEAMLAEAPELANTIRGLFKVEAPNLGSLIDKLRTPDRQSVLPMPNRWFLDPENHPEVQGLVQKVLDANNMVRSDFHSGAYVDPKTGKIIDTQIHNDVGVAIDPITNRPVMTTGGVSGMEQLPTNWRDVGSATKSNLVKQGKFTPVGGDPILNDIGFLSTIEKSGAGHKYGLGMEYANPTMLHNTLTGDNPTLRPQSYGDLFGIGDVVGQIQTTKQGPIHDVYEKLLVAPKGSDVQGVKLSKKKGGSVHLTNNPDAMMMELQDKKFSGGGLAAKIAEKLGTKVLPLAEREANKAAFLEPSKVKDVMYHGTNKDINSFKVPQNALGVWATKNPNVANDYATISARGVNEPPSLYPVHIRLKNPANEQQFGDAWDLASKDSSRLGWNTHDERHKKILQDQGFDGAILDDSVVVFDPTQIKSATGNQGTYDVTNPDITKKRGGLVHIKGR